MRQLFLVLILMTTSFVTFAQSQSQPLQQVNKTLEISDFLERAAAQADKYGDSFKDLFAEEQKSIEIFDKNGKLKTQRLVVSDFVLYESQVEQGNATEYRNVREVDGKAVSNRDKRATALFERIGKAKSTSDELKRIDDEGTKYDKDFRVTGLIFFTQTLLSREARDAFRFEQTGRETINGRETVILSFQQLKSTPKITFDFDAPRKLQSSEPLARGKVWLDAETAGVWREEHEVFVNSPLASSPLKIIAQKFEFARSEFEILLPQKFTIEFFNPRENKAAKNYETTISSRLIQTYNSFKRFSVTAK